MSPAVSKSTKETGSEQGPFYYLAETTARMQEQLSRSTQDDSMDGIGRVESGTVPAHVHWDSHVRSVTDMDVLMSRTLRDERL